MAAAHGTAGQSGLRPEPHQEGFAFLDHPRPASDMLRMTASALGAHSLESLSDGREAPGMRSRGSAPGGVRGGAPALPYPSPTRALLLAALSSLAWMPTPACAQPAALAQAGTMRPVSRDEPVTFSADEVEYDKERALVSARGHVEAWQGGRVVRADQITFDRNAGVIAASGNVVLLEPDGQVLFADYAELTRDMSQGILKNMRALLEKNGRLAANGARRTGGVLNELSRVVYSACDLCKDDPTRPPLWQIEAASAVQDTEHKTIEYRDAVLRMYGIPVAYAPFFWHPDPSVPRSSGLLPPAIGVSSGLGAFYGQPYYWVINGQSDLTLTPMITTRAGGMLDAEYRHRFNNGTLIVNLSGGYGDPKWEGSLATRGQFTLDETWRWGFDISRASSSRYVRDLHVLLGRSGDASVLPSTVYLEGFGQGSYARLDAKGYQALTTVSNSRLPVVLPRYIYSYTGTPDRLGGRLSLDTGFFNVIRDDGTSTRRAHLNADWERPFQGKLGDLWSLTLHGTAAAYDARDFQRQPNFGPRRNVDTAQGVAGAALDVRWPWMRDAGKWGTQVIEPRLQLIVSPRTGDSQFTRIPNEDSFSFEFSDANLFGFNRFSGHDRLEGGSRLNAALKGTWYLGGTILEGFAGQSYRAAEDHMFPTGSGLRETVSDIVARATVSPASWLDVTYRTRLDRRTMNIRMADATASVGTNKFRLSGGYLYSTFNPYTFYDALPPPAPGSAYFAPRNEITLAVSSKWEHYRFSGYARRNLTTNQTINYGLSAAYEDECFIFDIRFNRRFTSLLNDHGSTALLFYFTFKTVGQFGYRAI